MKAFEEEIKQRITLTLSQESDETGLSECRIIHDALEVYQHQLEHSRQEGLCYPDYFHRASALIAGIRYELTEELMQQLNELKTGKEGRSRP